MSDLIDRQAAIDCIIVLLEQKEEDDHDKTWNNAIRSAVNSIAHHTPSAQPDWDEMMVICDNCGHAIHVKRV